MESIDSYYAYIQKPWGELFYAVIQNQLSFAVSLNVLDFGSGFGVTANYLAADNNVTAVEPNEKMCALRFKDRSYWQIIGGLDDIKRLPEESFDLLVCHNVLEYVDEKEAYIAVFSRLLKKGGKLSLVKHNRVGGIIHKAVFENNLQTALDGLDGAPAVSQNFGEIKLYGSGDIERWAAEYSFRPFKAYGARTFFGLIQNNDIKYNPEWRGKALELEIKAAEIEAFRDIAFYNHIILEKTE